MSLHLNTKATRTTYMHGGTKGVFMNVFLLIEEYDQNSYINKRKESASPFSSVMGVYENQEKAEREKEQYEKQKNKDDSCSYFIEERPLL